MTSSSQSQLTWSSSTEPGSLGARGGSTGLGPTSSCPSSSVSSNEILATEADLSSLCLLGAQLSVLVEVECFLFLFEMKNGYEDGFVLAAFCVSQLLFYFWMDDDIYLSLICLVTAELGTSKFSPLLPRSSLVARKEASTSRSCARVEAAGSESGITRSGRRWRTRASTCSTIQYSTVR